jgi:hypothetical protein
MSFNPEGIIRALWVKDSETSDELLIDLDKNCVIAKRVDGKIVNIEEEVE